jgi:NAD+ synthase
MNLENKKNKIVDWLLQYSNTTKTNGFVIGVSGGVDSALTSTLCALTGKNVVIVGMPIHQEEKQFTRSEKHMQWLCENFKNVKKTTINLTDTFETFKSSSANLSELALANTRSRLRMVALYSIANTNNFLVVGTGNKVEDYGIGFFTKYGDGGVDLSPIADLMKSEVREMSKYLGVSDEIVNAIPTDGLWGDSRSDEEQIGASYSELEWALKYYDENGYNLNGLEERQTEVLNIYVQRHKINKHKLETPPICLL